MSHPDGPYGGPILVRSMDRARRTPVHPPLHTLGGGGVGASVSRPSEGRRGREGDASVHERGCVWWRVGVWIHVVVGGDGRTDGRRTAARGGREDEGGETSVGRHPWKSPWRLETHPTTGHGSTLPPVPTTTNHTHATTATSGRSKPSKRCLRSTWQRR